MAVQTEDKKLNGAGLTTLWGIIKQFFSSKQDKVSPLGSATKPVYISGDGTFGECDSYKDSTVKNVVGEFSDEGAEFAFRPSAGAVDIESGIADHGGHLQVIKGNTVAWNQQVQNGNFTSNSHWSAVNYISFTVSNNIATTLSTEDGDNFVENNVPMIIGHKYIFVGEAKSDAENVGVFMVYYGSANSYLDLQIFSINTWERFAAMFTCASNQYNFVRLRDIEKGVTHQYRNINVIDLTLIYGAGNEPTTVEQFEADYMKWFGKPLTYEEYDAGSLKPVKMAGIKTVGFNLWGGEIESGTVDYVSGEKLPDANYWRSKDYMSVLPNTSYFINKLTRVFFYDADKNFISYETAYAAGLVFTTPTNCSYILFRCTNDVNRDDICINLHHSGDRDGQYEPYWESTLNVPITSLKGKLNGTGSSVVVFPDGMKKAGSVYDEIVRRGDKTYAIKRVGSVDLGTMYPYPSGNDWYDFILNDKHVGLNMVCNKYPIQSMDNSPYEAIAAWPQAYGKTIYFRTTENIADKMSGGILFYELETPEEYLLDDFELPQVYDVDDWGTEEIILGTNGCAPTLDLKYGINAGDTIKNLPHNYVSINRQNFSEGQQAIARQNIGAASQEDMTKVQKQIEALSKATESDLWVDMGLPSGILWAKRNIDLSQPNGFTASEYQYDCSFFSWGNTDGHNPTSATSFGEYSWGSGNDTEPYVSSDGAALTGDITPSFDAARVNLGTPWRMPTKDDFVELFNSSYTKFINASGNDIDSATTSKLITINGVVGIRLKSLINGNIIFFACSGFGEDSSLNNKSSGGYYWGNSFKTSENGFCMNFGGTGFYPKGGNYRYRGFSIRPVM